MRVLREGRRATLRAALYIVFNDASVTAAHDSIACSGEPQKEAEELSNLHDASLRFPSTLCKIAGWARMTEPGTSGTAALLRISIDANTPGSLLLSASRSMPDSNPRRCSLEVRAVNDPELEASL